MNVKVPALALAIILAAIFLAGQLHAHKGVTSKFTYNAEVYPIFLNRCGHCHIEGGVGPMSLLSYPDAYPWAESLRAELLETEGPSADAVPNFVRLAHRDLPARELDVILDWATGGNPEGDQAKAPSPVKLTNTWTHGEPPLALSLPAPYQMPADVMEATQEFVLAIDTTSSREVNAIDVLAGTPSIVREVELQLSSGNRAPLPLGVWTPRQNPAPIVLNPPVRLPPGSHLAVRIHYKKTWVFEGRPMTDRSTIGLYFAP
jgi:hypothetical protein